MEKIIRRGAEEGFSAKEREKIEGEVTRSAINDSGTMPYRNLLYKGNVQGRYGQVYELVIIWSFGLNDCIYCMFYIHTIQDYR